MAEDDTSVPSEYFQGTRNSTKRSRQPEDKLEMQTLKKRIEANMPLSIPLTEALRVGSDFFSYDSIELANRLLGCYLVRKFEDGTVVRGMIVETEAYPVPGSAVLIRAVHPTHGEERMVINRASKRKAALTRPFKSHELCSGPSKLCIAFDIDKLQFNEQNLIGNNFLWIEQGENIPLDQIVTSTRIGISGAGRESASKLLRFYVLSNPSVSVRDKAAELAKAK
ncbi:DNA-3-methyladenine glycosylase-like isoform X2 [Artemia franciscana]|uniref:DNA-3-methyladenine glycosylase-like isoform X2 n=1 Tax=Artemia franciscana TaxID=6661 RepID=UPI0032DB689B